VHLLRTIDLCGAFDRCCGAGTVVLQKGMGSDDARRLGDQQADRDTVVRRRLCSDRSSPRLERQLPGFEDFLGWKCDKASSV
jgi:hypothetical protein